jgi:hypothetical protein
MGNGNDANCKQASRSASPLGSPLGIETRVVFTAYLHHLRLV